jgi:hypothetical protein
MDDIIKAVFGEGFTGGTLVVSDPKPAAPGARFVAGPVYTWTPDGFDESQFYPTRIKSIGGDTLTLAHNPKRGGK